MNRQGYDRRKEQHRCVRCGKQDDRTLAGFINCRACREIERQAGAVVRKRMVQNNRCTACGIMDERTLSGKTRCAKCAAFYRKIERNRYRQRKEEHCCGKCGAPLPEGWPFVLCTACRTRQSGLPA